MRVAAIVLMLTMSAGSASAGNVRSDGGVLLLAGSTAPQCQPGILHASYGSRPDLCPRPLALTQVGHKRHTALRT